MPHQQTDGPVMEAVPHIWSTRRRFLSLHNAELWNQMPSRGWLPPS